MPFKNLLERFNATVDTLYGKNSTTDRGDGTRGNEPYIEVKPNTPDKSDYGLDSRSAPIRSIVTDSSRLLQWSKSSKGLQWYLNQGVLQTGNTFGDTRGFNPIEVLANVQPFIHVQRSLSDAGEVSVSGNAEKRASARSIGAAGRLQQQTSKFVVGNVTSGGKNNIYDQIFKIIPPSNVVNVLSGIFNVNKTGLLGVDQRPEFDMDGSGTYTSLYSVKVWNGFQRLNDPVVALDSAANNLRSGNVRGALGDLSRAINGDVLNAVSNTVSNVINSLFGSRNRVQSAISTLTNQSSILGKVTDVPPIGGRYFITGQETAYRYLEGTVDLHKTPKASVSFLNRKPILFSEPITLLPSSMSFPDDSVRSESSLSSPRDISISRPNTTQTENPAQDAMKYGDLSLQKRYEQTDARLDFIRTQLPKQKSDWLNTIIGTSHPAGFGGGVSLDKKEASVNPTAKYKLQVPNRKYFFDTMNSSKMGPQQVAGTDLTDSDMINIKRAANADTLVDLFFFDYVNKMAIPFRAYIQGLSQTVSPQFNDIMYIGRSERNIVYAGAKRDLSFTLMIHAFNEEELSTVWRKINYLTGLCYPSKYANGYMVPPLMKLTLGDLYNNQPCYFKSFATTTDDDVSWEITPGMQVPHGIKINVSLALIEKAQMSALDYNPGSATPGDPLKAFYNFGIPRFAGNASSNTTNPSPDTSGGLVAGASAGAARGTGTDSSILSDQYGISSAVNTAASLSSGLLHGL